MNNEPNQFVVKFGNLPTAQRNQLAAELKRVLSTIQDLPVERLKEDPNTLDEGSGLLILIATAVVTAHNPQTMLEAVIAGALIDFVYRHGADLQIENKLGEIFQITKDVSHEALAKVKKQLQEFLKK